MDGAWKCCKKWRAAPLPHADVVSLLNKYIPDAGNWFEAARTRVVDPTLLGLTTGRRRLSALSQRAIDVIYSCIQYYIVICFMRHPHKATCSPARTQDWVVDSRNSTRTPAASQSPLAARLPSVRVNKVESSTPAWPRRLPCLFPVRCTSGQSSLTAAVALFSRLTCTAWLKLLLYVAGRRTGCWLGGEKGRKKGRNMWVGGVEEEGEDALGCGVDSR